jgi:hypothetical protein
MPTLLFIIALVLHFWFGWAAWLSILVSFGTETILSMGYSLLQCLSKTATVPREAWILIGQAFGGALLAMVTFYIPMVVMSYFWVIQAGRFHRQEIISESLALPIFE